MNRRLSLFFLLMLLISIVPKAALAQAANPYASQAYLITDTALADGSDEVEIDVLLMDMNFSFSTDQPVYCATNRSSDRVTVGSNEDGWVRITITSEVPGSAAFAISLESQEAARAFLSGTGGGSAAAKIVQIEQKWDVGQIYFSPGSLDEDSSYFEFDKDTVVVTGGAYADYIKAKIFLRTQLDHPVANQYVTLSTNLKGATIWPTSLVTNAQGEGEFRISSTSLGDAEIIATIGKLQISEYVTFDTPENIYESDDEDLWEEEEEEEEEPELIISPAMTKVSFSKLVAREHGSNANYGESTKEEDWDRIVASGIALSEEEEPVQGASKVNAYATAGVLNKTKPAATSEAGAFSFTITSDKVTQGTIAIGLGTPDQLKAYIEGKLSAEACGLIKSQAYYFGSRKLDKFLLCALGKTEAVENGVAKTLEVAPYSDQGRTMLALRPIADAIGATTSWDDATKTATIVLDKKELRITVGSPTMTRQEYSRIDTINLDVPATIKDNRTVFPLRSVAEAFGMTVVYEPVDKSICISSEK
jgi:hypothetical protein